MRCNGERLPTSYCHGPVELLSHRLGGNHGDEEASGDDLPLRQDAGTGLQKPDTSKTYLFFRTLVLLFSL